MCVVFSVFCISVSCVGEFLPQGVGDFLPQGVVEFLPHGYPRPPPLNERREGGDKPRINPGPYRHVKRRCVWNVRTAACPLASRNASRIYTALDANL